MRAEAPGPVTSVSGKWPTTVATVFSALELAGITRNVPLPAVTPGIWNRKLDPGVAEVCPKAAETAVKLRRLTGLGVSRTADYVKAPPHVIEEFLTHPKGL